MVGVYKNENFLIFNFLLAVPLWTIVYTISETSEVNVDNETSKVNVTSDNNEENETSKDKEKESPDNNKDESSDNDEDKEIIKELKRIEVFTDNFIEKLENNERLNGNEAEELENIKKEFSSHFDEESENNVVAGLKEIRGYVIEEQGALASTSSKNRVYKEGLDDVHEKYKEGYSEEEIREMTKSTSGANEESHWEDVD